MCSNLLLHWFDILGVVVVVVVVVVVAVEGSSSPLVCGCSWAGW